MSKARRVVNRYSICSMAEYEDPILEARFREFFDAIRYRSDGFTFVRLRIEAEADTGVEVQLRSDIVGQTLNAFEFRLKWGLQNGLFSKAKSKYELMELYEDLYKLSCDYETRLHELELKWQPEGKVDKRWPFFRHLTKS